MESNRLYPEDDVRVEMYFGHDPEPVDVWQGSGFHKVNEALQAAYEGSRHTNLDIEDYVYRIVNLTTGTSARYRVNAGGHLAILPEER